MSECKQIVPPAYKSLHPLRSGGKNLEVSSFNVSEGLDKLWEGSSEPTDMISFLENETSNHDHSPQCLKRKDCV